MNISGQDSDIRSSERTITIRKSQIFILSVALIML
jgi:hypothetical protein